MKFQMKHIAAVAALLSAGVAFAQAAKAPEPDWTVTGNMSINSDYRFRGFTQTNYGPAFQGGFDVAHKSGAYFGNWNSNVAQGLLNGASLEMDFYGGFKGEIAKDVGYDVGAIYYYYPKSGVDTVNKTKVDNTEIYAGLSYGPFSGKLYMATGDYFKTAALVAAPNSTKGTTYLDLSYSAEVGGITYGAHYGLLTLKNNTQAALTQSADVGGAALPKTVGDFKLSAGKDIGSGYVLTAAYVGTSKKGYFATDLGAAKAAGKSALVLSLAKSF
jgi:uncharacterized protein (TIGR02001 family)